MFSCYWSTSVHMLSLTISLNLLNFFNLLNFLNFSLMFFMSGASFYYFLLTWNTQVSLKNDNSRWIRWQNFIRQLDIILRWLEQKAVSIELWQNNSLSKESFCWQGKYLLLSEKKTALIYNIDFFPSSIPIQIKSC